MLNLQFQTGNEHNYSVIIISPLVTFITVRSACYTFITVQSGCYTASITVIIIYHKYFSHLLVMSGHDCEHVLIELLQL